MCGRRCALFLLAWRFFLPKWWNKLLRTLVPVNLPAFICMHVCVCVCEVQPANDKIKNKMVRNAVTIKCSHKINYIQRSTKSKLVHSHTHTHTHSTGILWVLHELARYRMCSALLQCLWNQTEKKTRCQWKKCARERKNTWLSLKVYFEAYSVLNIHRLQTSKVLG